MRRICPLILLLVTCCTLYGKPLNIIIVTSKDSSENGYSDFLREIYMDNDAVEIDDDRYKENSLTESEKVQLAQADLVIISSHNSGSDYNDDSAFWSTLPVPILCHSISVCRSNNHDNWDWFNSDKTTNSISDIIVSDPTDDIFDGIDVSSGTVPFFDTAMDIEVPDQFYLGNGTLLATDTSGMPMIVRFDGDEPNYYLTSLHDPNNAPRIYFALNGEPADFFSNASAPAKRLLRNAITQLLDDKCWLKGDINCDRVVDMTDLIELSGQWLDQGALLSADIVENGKVDIADFGLIAQFWLKGFDITSPAPNPAEWTDVPFIGDFGILEMKAKNADDDLHGVQYYYECLEDPALSSGWQYDRTFSPTGTLPIGTTLTFRTKSRDTSSRLNETLYSSSETVRTDGVFYRSADASAAVAIDSQRFIMADDELGDNDEVFLQVYDWNAPESIPLIETNIASTLTLNNDHPEPDIEGATWFNGRVFWICSHGRNRYGDYWKSRYNFFATTVAADGSVTVDGNCDNLIDALIQYDRTWSTYNLGLEAAIGVSGDHINESTIPALAPKDSGLNIEGLCATADGSKMLIGFRNPRPGGMALVIPMTNPQEVVLNGAAPILEAPILIDLDGLGIRSIEYSPSIGEYLIVAGSHEGGSNAPVQYLYNYDFQNQDRDKLATFSDITPEAMFQFPQSNEINLLSDDGTRIIQTPSGPQINKLLPREQRRFRTRTIKP